MVHLLGIDHKFQVVASRPFVKGGLDEFNWRHLSLAFEEYLARLLDSVPVAVVAEEYSQRQLERMRLTDPTIYLVAEKACQSKSSIAHVAFDLDQTERDELYAAHGTSEAEDRNSRHALREAEWMKRLSPHLSAGSLLCICGANHIDSMLARFNAAHVAASVLVKDLEL
jgi:hypothetical protein